MTLLRALSLRRACLISVPSRWTGICQLSRDRVVSPRIGQPQKPDATSGGRRGSSLTINVYGFFSPDARQANTNGGVLEAQDCCTYLYCHRTKYFLQVGRGCRCEVWPSEPVLLAEYIALPSTPLRQDQG